MSEYINNIIYGVNSFVTGLKVTWHHFINKKDLVATLQYPHEKWPIPERNIGFDHSEYNLIRSRLHVDIDDCISCMQCEKACPADAIHVKDNLAVIDYSKCIMCGMCIAVCPKKIIVDERETKTGGKEKNIKA